MTIYLSILLLLGFWVCSKVLLYLIVLFMDQALPRNKSSSHPWCPGEAGGCILQLHCHSFLCQGSMSLSFGPDPALQLLYISSYYPCPQMAVVYPSIKPFRWDFPGGTVVKNLPANAGDTGSSPGPGRYHMPRSN